MSAEGSEFHLDDFSDMLSQADDLSTGSDREFSNGLAPQPRYRKSMVFPGGSSPVPVPADVTNPVPATAQAASQPSRRRLGTAPKSGAQIGGGGSPNPSDSPPKGAASPAAVPPAGVPPSGNGATASPNDIAPPIESDTTNPGVSGNFIRVSCPCGNRLRVKPSQAGRTIECPKCDQPLKIPDPRRAASAAGTAFDFPARLKEHIAELQTELTALPASARKKTLGVFAFRSLRNRVKTDPKGRDGLERIRRAIEALGESGDERAYPLLVELWERDHGTLRSVLLTALGESHDLRGLILLLQLLVHPLPEVRLAAVIGLGASSDSRAVLPLMWFGMYDQKNRFAVGDAILKIGEAAIRPLTRLLEQSEERLVVESVVLLGRLKAESAVKPLMELLATGRVASARGDVAEALGLIGDERALSLLMPMLTDSDDSIRVQAATALSRIPRPQCLAALVQGLGDAHAEVRKRCAAALGELGDPRTGAALVPLLNDPSQEVRLAAAESLGRIGDERAVPWLVGLLADPEEGVVLKALLALRKLKHPAAIPALLALLQSPQPRIRQKAVDALGVLGDAVVAEQLEQLLRNDRAEDVRAAAAKALGEIRDPGSVDALQNAIHDVFSVRCKAIVSLGQIGDESSVGLLISLLRDPVPEVRYHAAQALAEMGCKAAIVPIESQLDDSDPMVRRGAAKALEKLGCGDADTLVGNDAQRNLNRSGRALTRWLARLTPNALWGLLTSGSGAARGIAAAVVLLPLVVWWGFAYFGGGPAREKVLVIRGQVSSLNFSADGQKVLIGRTAAVVEAFDVKTLKCDRTVKVTESMASIIGIGSPNQGDEWVLATAELAGAFDKSGKPLWEVDGHTGEIVEFRVTRDRRRAMVRGRDGLISFWSLPDGNRAGPPIKLPVDKLHATALAPAADLIAGAGQKGPISIWSTETGQLVIELSGLPKGVSSIAFSPDGQRLVAVSPGGELAVWALSTSRPEFSVTVEPAGALSHVSFNADGTEIFCLHNGIAVGQFTLADRSFQVHRVQGLSQASCVAVSPDGTLLVVGGEENTGAVLFDLQKRETLGVLDVK